MKHNKNTYSVGIIGEYLTRKTELLLRRGNVIGRMN